MNYRTLNTKMRPIDEDYAMSFIKNFTNLPEETIRNTIWEELHREIKNQELSTLELAKRIVETLNAEKEREASFKNWKTLYNKFTDKSLNARHTQNSSTEEASTSATIRDA